MKMPDQIENNMFAPCGMNCMVCYVHLKNKKACNGCLSNDTNKPVRCKSCEIKLCAQEKGYAHCFECTDFPCRRIKNLEKSYQKRYQVSLVENSRLAKEKGLEMFFQKERLRWICKECKGIISLHDKECTECDNKA